MLSSVSSLLALALLAMTGSANGLAMSTSLVEREEPLPIACCSDSVPFRLRMKTNIKDDDPMADQKRNHYFSDKNPCYIACESRRVFGDVPSKLMAAPAQSRRTAEARRTSHFPLAPKGHRFLSS